MLGSGYVLKRRRLVASGVLLLSVSGCGGEQFTPGGGGAGAPGGSDGGVGGSAGSAVGGQSGGNSGGEGAGGSGGTGGSESCSCKAGEYCRDGSTDCFACTELSRLSFAAPERLSTLSDAGRNARFPRIGSTSTDLLYFFEGVGIRYTTDASTSAGSAVKSTLPEDNAPLLLTAGGLTVGDATGSNFIFDRLQEGRRQIYVGRWAGGLQELALAPSPFNGENNDFSMAVATQPSGETTPRAYWMSDRGMVTTLVTARPGDTSATPVALKLGIEKCEPSSADLTDLTPWITPDGRTLLFSYPGLDAGCARGETGRDLYTVPLLPSDGQPTLEAVIIDDLNSAADDVDPSFSADMCHLYFASNRDGENFALYRARRH